MHTNSTGVPASTYDDSNKLFDSFSLSSLDNQSPENMLLSLGTPSRPFHSNSFSNTTPPENTMFPFGGFSPLGSGNPEEMTPYTYQDQQYFDQIRQLKQNMDNAITQPYSPTPPTATSTTGASSSQKPATTSISSSSSASQATAAGSSSSASQEFWSGSVSASQATAAEIPVEKEEAKKAKKKIENFNGRIRGKAREAEIKKLADEVPALRAEIAELRAQLNLKTEEHKDKTK